MESQQLHQNPHSLQLLCRNFDSILKIPIPSSRNSSISYIPNIIALSIMESQQLLLQATILRIEKMLKVLLQDTGIQRESIYLPNSIIISFPFYMFHYHTSDMNTNRWMVVCSYSIREMHQIMDKNGKNGKEL
ncbi:hypothetical protein FOSTERSO_1854 [Saccharomyces cerevisiae FostersO]|nr:hypothetical protein FOSTERSO_1854 [Saccharomyces cerevisiae FostersO]